MAIAIVALLAFGGSYAYFTATTTAKVKSDITTGHVKLTQDATFTGTLTNIVPGANLTTGKVTVTPDAVGTGSYIAVKVIIELKKSGSETWEDASSAFKLTESLGSNWYANAAENATFYIYGSAVGTLTSVTEKAAIDFTKAALVFDVNDNSNDGAASTSGFMDAAVRVSIQSVSIQSSDGNGGNLANATALTELAKLFNATPFGA